MIVVLGPTATGKSDLAVNIARAISAGSSSSGKSPKSPKKRGFGAEIISADSRQIYAGLDIGSGKITKKEMRGVPHHGLDILSPRRKQMFTASKFQDYAYAKANEIMARGNVPILCGGTGFYIQAVADGIVLPDVPVNPELRAKLRKLSLEKLQQRLLKLDSKRYEEIDKQNPVRLIRAIEIATALGTVPKAKHEPKFETLRIGLDTSDSVLKDKILRRIHARLKKGMIAEAKRLHGEGLSWKRMREFGLEYGLLADLLQGRLTKEQFVERLSFDIRHYVRRQRAWFRKDESIIWVDASKKPELKRAEKLAKKFLLEP